MNIDPRVRIFGDLNYRNKKCPQEATEQQTVINQVRIHYPFLVYTSIKNEDKRTSAQMKLEQSMGFRAGVSDLVFFGNPTLCIEMKRQDHTMSKWQPEQQPFLIEAQAQGAMTCVCFGWQAAMQAIEEWLSIRKL